MTSIDIKKKQKFQRVGIEEEILGGGGGGDNRDLLLSFVDLT